MSVIQEIPEFVGSETMISSARAPEIVKPLDRPNFWSTIAFVIIPITAVLCLTSWLGVMPN